MERTKRSAECEVTKSVRLRGDDWSQVKWGLTGQHGRGGQGHLVPQQVWTLEAKKLAHEDGIVSGKQTTVCLFSLVGRLFLHQTGSLLLSWVSNQLTCHVSRGGALSSCIYTCRPNQPILYHQITNSNQTDQNNKQLDPPQCDQKKKEEEKKKKRSQNPSLRNDV